MGPAVDGLSVIELLGVTLQPAFQSAAMAGLVAGHLMDGVVDSIQAVLLCDLGQIELALSKSVRHAILPPKEALILL